MWILRTVVLQSLTVKNPPRKPGTTRAMISVLASSKQASSNFQQQSSASALFFFPRHALCCHTIRSSHGANNICLLPFHFALLFFRHGKAWRTDTPASDHCPNQKILEEFILSEPLGGVTSGEAIKRGINRGIMHQQGAFLVCFFRFRHRNHPSSAS